MVVFVITGDSCVVLKLFAGLVRITYRDSISSSGFVPEKKVGCMGGWVGAGWGEACQINFDDQFVIDGC